jgi:hypothetical protein
MTRRQRIRILAPSEIDGYEHGVVFEPRDAISEAFRAAERSVLAVTFSPVRPNEQWSPYEVEEDDAEIKEAA